MVRVAGADPGTSSLDLLILDDGKVADQARFAPADLEADSGLPVRWLAQRGPLDLVAGPSGYGLPLVAASGCGERLSRAGWTGVPGSCGRGGLAGWTRGRSARQGVSVRNGRGPARMDWKPGASRRSVSKSLQRPSGPMAGRIRSSLLSRATAPARARCAPTPPASRSLRSCTTRLSRDRRSAKAFALLSVAAAALAFTGGLAAQDTDAGGDGAPFELPHAMSSGGTTSRRSHSWSNP